MFILAKGAVYSFGRTWNSPCGGWERLARSAYGLCQSIFRHSTG